MNRRLRIVVLAGFAVLLTVGLFFIVRFRERVSTLPTPTVSPSPVPTPTIGPTVTPQPGAERPVWRRGDTWRYQLVQNATSTTEIRLRVEGTEQYSGQEAWRVSRETEGRPVNYFLYDKDLALVAVKDESDRVIREQAGFRPFDFPLQEGKKWNGDVWFSKIAYEVGAPKTISVPAGTFPAFPVRRTQTTAGKEAFTGEMWYAPAVKFTAKEVTSGADGSSSELLLLEYIPAP